MKVIKNNVIRLNQPGPPTPCPSHTYAVLGVQEPVQVQCGKLSGHEGAHEFRLTWDSQ